MLEDLNVHDQKFHIHAADRILRCAAPWREGANARRWSIAELGLGSEDRQALFNWAGVLTRPSLHAALDDQHMDWIDRQPHPRPRLFGLCFIAYAAEYAREHGRGGEIWPTTRRGLSADARDYLFHNEAGDECGQPRERLRNALRSAWENFGLRRGGAAEENGFAGYATLHLQFGFSLRSAKNRLNEWLEREEWRPVAVNALLAHGHGPESAVELRKLFQKLVEFRQGRRAGDASLRQYLATNPWVRAEWVEDILKAAVRPLPTHLRGNTAPQAQEGAALPDRGPVEWVKQPVPRWEAGGRNFRFVVEPLAEGLAAQHCPTDVEYRLMGPNGARSSIFWLQDNMTLGYGNMSQLFIPAALREWSVALTADGDEAMDTPALPPQVGEFWKEDADRVGFRRDNPDALPLTASLPAAEMILLVERDLVPQGLDPVPDWPPESPWGAYFKPEGVAGQISLTTTDGVAAGFLGAPSPPVAPLQFSLGRGQLTWGQRYAFDVKLAPREALMRLRIQGQSVEFNPLTEGDPNARTFRAWVTLDPRWHRGTIRADAAVRRADGVVERRKAILPPLDVKGMAVRNTMGGWKALEPNGEVDARELAGRAVQMNLYDYLNHPPQMRWVIVEGRREVQAIHQFGQLFPWSGAPDGGLWGWGMPLKARPATFGVADADADANRFAMAVTHRGDIADVSLGNGGLVIRRSHYRFPGEWDGVVWMTADGALATVPASDISVSDDGQVWTIPWTFDELPLFVATTVNGQRKGGWWRHDWHESLPQNGDSALNRRVAAALRFFQPPLLSNRGPGNGIALADQTPRGRMQTWVQARRVDCLAAWLLDELPMEGLVFPAQSSFLTVARALTWPGQWHEPDEAEALLVALGVPSRDSGEGEQTDADVWRTAIERMAELDPLLAGRVLALAFLPRNGSAARTHACGYNCLGFLQQICVLIAGAKADNALAEILGCDVKFVTDLVNKVAAHAVDAAHWPANGTYREDHWRCVGNASYRTLALRYVFKRLIDKLGRTSLLQRIPS